VPKELSTEGIFRDVWHYPSDYIAMGLSSRAFTLVDKQRYDEVCEELEVWRRRANASRAEYINQLGEENLLLKRVAQKWAKEIGNQRNFGTDDELKVLNLLEAL